MTFAADQAFITCSGLSFRIGEEVVLDRLSFAALKGRHTILKGESGSGKSTVLKLLMGFLKPSAGSIRFGNGRTVKDIRKQTAWLPQDLNLGAGTVGEVMRKPFSFAANRSGTPDHNTFLSVLADLGLSSDDFTKQFRDLSTGQRQRVGLALCYLLDKPLLLLDEPTSSLDAASKQKAADLLLGGLNRTIVSASHDPFWVEQGDQVIILS